MGVYTISMKSISYLGLAVAIVPFLGVPNSWKTIFFVIVGLTIFLKIYLANVRGNNKDKGDSDVTFKQNKPEQIKSEENYDRGENLNLEDSVNLVDVDKNNAE